MGKNIRVQRRGRGTTTFRAPKKRKMAEVKYPTIGAEGANGVIKGLLHDRGRGAPLAHVQLSGGADYYVPASEGVHVGQGVDLGSGAPLVVGNVVTLGAIPEGTMVSNIELKPGDGGRIARSSGTFATVVSHIGKRTVLKLPSRKNVEVPSGCRATVGIVAGGGRKEKPFLKAGEKFYLMRARGKIYPQSKGISMVAASHPHGGGRHRHVGKSTTVSRDTPPGRKVGLIAARTSGKKKRARRE